VFVVRVKLVRPWGRSERQQSRVRGRSEMTSRNNKTQICVLSHSKIEEAGAHTSFIVDKTVELLCDTYATVYHPRTPVHTRNPLL
jgi:hypothetical protein